MRLLTLVNVRDGLKATQSTTALAIEVAKRGGESWVAGIDDVSLSIDGDVAFSALRVGAEPPEETLRQLAAGAPERVACSDVDAIFMRTNPGRDMPRTALHEATLNLCRMASERGVVVLNHPDALRKASDKLFLAYLPEKVRPRMVVSRETDVLREFVEGNKGPSVLKPLFGTQGRGVFRVSGAGPNLGALIEVLTADGYVVAQEYLRRAPEGDTRVIIVDGEPLEQNGKVCAVRRVPRDGEFRSNVHLGGKAVAAEASRAVLRAARDIGEHLVKHGVWMAGVDLVGTKAVEVNVRSPGGLVDAGGFEGVDFVAAAVDSIASKIDAGPTA